MGSLFYIIEGNPAFSVLDSQHKPVTTPILHSVFLELPANVELNTLSSKEKPLRSQVGIPVFKNVKMSPCSPFP